MDALNGGVKLFKGGPEGPWKHIAVRGEGRRVRAEDPEIELAVEEGDAQTIGCDVVAMGAKLALNETAETEASQVIRHLRGGIGPPEEGGHAWAQVAMAKAGGEMGEATEGLAQRLDAGVAEAQRGDAKVTELQRPLDSIQGLGGERAVVAHPFDGEQRAIDVIAKGA